MKIPSIGKEKLDMAAGALDPVLVEVANTLAAILPEGMRSKVARSIIGVLSGYLNKIPQEMKSTELATAATKLRDFLNFLNASLGKGISPAMSARKWRESYFAEMSEKIINSENPQEIIDKVDKQVAAIDTLAKKLFGETDTAKPETGGESTLSQLDGMLAEKMQSWRLRQKWLK